MELLLQLCSRNLQGLCSPGHVLHKVGPERSCSTQGTGAGEKEELLDLQPELGVWDGVKLNKQSSIPAENFSCVEE